MRFLGMDVGTGGTRAVVIDQTGKLKAIFRKVKVDGHVDEVLAALKA